MPGQNWCVYLSAFLLWNWNNVTPLLTIINILRFSEHINYTNYRGYAGGIDKVTWTLKNTEYFRILMCNEWKKVSSIVQRSEEVTISQFRSVHMLNSMWTKFSTALVYNETIPNTAKMQVFRFQMYCGYWNMLHSKMVPCKGWNRDHV